MKAFERLIIAAVVGLAFSLGYLIGRVSAPPQLQHPHRNCFQELVKHESEYQNIQKEVKLTYYKELFTQPKTTPTEKMATEEAVANLELEITPKPKAIEPEKPTPEKMAGDLAKVLGSDTPTQVKQTVTLYAIQIAAFPDRTSGETMIATLNSKGLKPTLVDVKLPDKGTIYRVRILGFKSRAEAVAFKQKNQLDGIVLFE